MKNIFRLEGNRSLTTTLTSSFFGVSLIGLIILGGLLLFFNIRVHQTAIYTNQHLIAHDAAKTVSNFLLEKISVLETIFWIYNPNEMTVVGRKEILHGLLGIQPSFKQIIIFDKEEKETSRVSRRSRMEFMRYELKFKKEIIAQIKLGLTYLSPVYIDEFTLEPLVVVAVPVKDIVGDVQASVVAEINLKFMWDLVDQIKIGDTGYAYVVDRNGNLISFGDASRVLKNENVKHISAVSEFILDTNSLRSPFVSTYKGIKQSTVVGTYVPLGNPDWAVVTELPWEEAYSQTIIEIIIAIIALVLIVFIISILGIYVAKRLSIPIVNLMNTATSIAGGEKNILAEIKGPKEVAALAEAFNSMTTQLRSINKELEQQIAEVKRTEKELREKTKELDNYFTNSLDLLCIADTDGNFRRLNKEWEIALGYFLHELEGKKFLDFVHPEDIKSTEEVVAELGKQKEVLNFVNRYKCKDGAYRWLEWRSFPFGNLIYAAARDITERKIIEEALQLTRFTVDHAADAIYWIDSNAKIVDVNQSACNTLGYKRSELIKMSLMDIDSQFSIEHWTEAWEKIKQYGTLTRETIHKTKDGRLIPVEIIANYIKFGGQELDCAFVRDITERKQADETKRLLAHTMESISEIATITNLEDKYTFVNEAFLRTYGYERNEVIGRHVSLVWSSNNPPDLHTQILEQSRVMPWRGEALNITKDGKEFPVLLRTSQVKDENGTVIGLVGIAEDISERKQLEAQLMQSQKMEAVGRLAGGIAHDFNNMISVILGYASLLEKSLTPSDPLMQNINAITNAAQRSANLTKQLLAYARRQVIMPIVVNLNDALSTLSKMLERLLGEDISLKLNLANDLWNIKFDPTQLDQILANLATNARDAIEDVGSIVIKTSNVVIDASDAQEYIDVVQGEYVLLSFSDSGKGIDNETQSRIFDPFFTTKPKGQGTGLGLSTVFGIMKQNNGFILINSEIGQGTTFKLYFPRFYGKAEKRSEFTMQEPQRRHETVLIVEDEKDLLDLNRITLEMYGYNVLTAQSPGDAILLVEKNKQKIELLITDVVMPGMNGRELKNRIESIKPGLKTIYMSGYTADVVANRGILEKGVHFIQKPFKPNELIIMVQKVLSV